MGADFRLHQGVSMSRPIRLTVGAGCQWFRKWCVLGARSSLQLKSGQSLQLAAVASSGSRCFCSLFSLELPRWMELSSDAMSNVYQFSDRNKSVIRDASNLYISSEGTILNFYPILGGNGKEARWSGEATGDFEFEGWSGLHGELLCQEQQLAVVVYISLVSALQKQRQTDL